MWLARNRMELFDPRLLLDPFAKQMLADSFFVIVEICRTNVKTYVEKKYVYIDQSSLFVFNNQQRLQ